jgi:hypothetical protein
MRFARRTGSRRGTLLGILIATTGACLTVPGVAGAQAPTQDAVVASIKEPGFIGAFIDVNVVSGPSGENPTGTVSYRSPVFHSFDAAPVCLKVTGNQATIVAVGPSPSDGEVIKLTVVDEAPGLNLDRVGSRRFSDPAGVTCDSPLAVGPVFGSVTVTDAQPFPTSKDQCKNGGYASFSFKNQGECVASVQRGPKPKP